MHLFRCVSLVFSRQGNKHLLQVKAALSSHNGPIVFCALLADGLFTVRKHVLPVEKAENARSRSCDAS
jgi:hypothetical protein